MKTIGDVVNIIKLILSSTATYIQLSFVNSKSTYTISPLFTCKILAYDRIIRVEDTSMHDSVDRFEILYQIGQQNLDQYYEKYQWFTLIERV